MLSHQSGSRGKTDGFRRLGKFQESYLQRGTAYRRGSKGTTGGGRTPGPAQGDSYHPQGGREVEGEITSKGVTKGRPDLAAVMRPVEGPALGGAGIYSLPSYQGTFLGRSAGGSVDTVHGGGAPQAGIQN